MTHAAQLSVPFDSPTAATQVLDSLAPEAAGLVDDRSRTRLSRSGAVVIVQIDAADLIALRAAVNTWCELLHVAESAEAIGSRAGAG